MIIISESEMEFGPFDENDIFYIEKSLLYKNVGENVKIAEFILKKNNSIIFLEAKKTAPDPRGVDSEKFPEYIGEISEKLTNTFNLLLSAKFRIANDSAKEVEDFIQLEEVSNKRLAFRLVIKEAEISHLRPIQDALQKELIAQSKIWKIEVKVINAEIARKYKLIS